MTFVEGLKDARKALGALATVWAAAVPLGIVSSPTAGYVTAGIGAAAAAVTYLLKNEPPAERAVEHRPAPYPHEDTPRG